LHECRLEIGEKLTDVAGDTKYIWRARDDTGEVHLQTTQSRMGRAKAKYSQRVLGRRGYVPKKLQRSSEQYKFVGRPSPNCKKQKANRKATEPMPGLRDGVYHYELWWGLSRERKRYFDEYPALGTHVVKPFQQIGGAGQFYFGIVTKVRLPMNGKHLGGLIEVRYEDETSERMFLLDYHLDVCPVSELWSEYKEVVLDSKQFDTWPSRRTGLQAAVLKSKFKDAILTAKLRECRNKIRLSTNRLCILELCCGGKSWAKFLQSQYPGAFIVTVDVIAKCTATHTADILEWKYEDYYPPHIFHLVWMSPPCTEYSPAKTTGEPRNLPRADAIVKACLDTCVQAIRKNSGGSISGVWFLENPRTLLHKRRCMAFLKGNIFVCSYCRYSTRYRKTTTIYSNVPELQLKKCCVDSPCKWVKANGVHPEHAQAGTNAKGVKGVKAEVAQSIPRKLLKDLLDQAKPYLSQRDMTLVMCERVV
jgi:hypothetical protein